MENRYVLLYRHELIPFPGNRHLFGFQKQDGHLLPLRSIRRAKKNLRSIYLPKNENKPAFFPFSCPGYSYLQMYHFTSHDHNQITKYTSNSYKLLKLIKHNSILKLHSHVLLFNTKPFTFSVIIYFISP